MMLDRGALATRFAGLGIRDRGSFWRLTGVLFLVYLSTGLWSPLLSVYTQSLGAGTRDIGLVLGTFQLTSLLSQFWWGSWSDRLGRRKPLVLFGTAGLAVAFVGMATSRQWGWLFPFRMLEGIALAAYSTGSLALIGDLLEDQRGRGRLMGLYRTSGSFAFSIAALSGGWLADRFSIRLPLLIAATCYALAFLLSAWIKEHGGQAAVSSRQLAGAGGRGTGDGGRRSEVGDQEFPIRESLSAPGPRPLAPGLWPFLSMVFLWTFGMGAVVLLWPVYMQSVGYSKTAVGGLWALAAMGEVPCFLLAGYLADRWGRRRVLLTGIVCMAGVFLGYTLSTSLLWLIAVQMLRSFAYASYEAPALLYATELGLRRQRGRLASFYYAASGGGGITGSVAGGAIAQETGLVAMYRGVVGLMLVGVLAAGRMLPQLRSVAEEHGLDQTPDGGRKEPEVRGV